MMAELACVWTYGRKNFREAAIDVVRMGVSGA